MSVLQSITWPHAQWLFDFTAYLQDHPQLASGSKLDLWLHYQAHPSDRNYFVPDQELYHWLKQQLNQSVNRYAQDTFLSNYYLEYNPDVKKWAQEAQQQGHYRTIQEAAWAHFVAYGQFERRMYRFADNPSANDIFVRCWPLVEQNPLQLNRPQLILLANTMETSQPHVNPHLPLGYIFLGQFIAHDITFNTTHNMSDPVSFKNHRTPRLDLDCLYSSDKASCPYLFNQDHTMIYHSGSVDDLMRNPQGMAIIGDPRNDENLIVCQLQLLMIKFHNKVVLQHPDWDLEQVCSYVTKCYQSIVVHDFLKRLTGYQFVDQLLAANKHMLSGARIPIEFSVAAFRFGHACLPDQIQLTPQPDSQTTLFQLFAARDRPVDMAWLFDLSEQAPKAKVIEPALVTSLTRLPFETPDDVPVNHLALRNLMRGQQMCLPSGQQLARYLSLPVLNMSSLDQIIPGLAQNTPLWYYILNEALLQESGFRLGPLGRYIVAGVIIDLLYYDSNSILHDSAWDYPITTMQQLIAYTYS